MRKTIDLASAIGSQKSQPAAVLTLAELVKAYATCHEDGLKDRLRKWVEAFGNESAWAITAEQLDLAAHAMVDHGYRRATANRDLSSLGTLYRWAKARRLSPRGFHSPTLGVTRFEEPIRRVYIEPEEIDALVHRAKAWPDRRFWGLRDAAEGHRCTQVRDPGAAVV